MNQNNADAQFYDIYSFMTFYDIFSYIHYYLYGPEILRWKKQKKVEKIRIKYIKWVLMIERNRPNYKTKMNELSVETTKKGLEYKEKNVEKINTTTMH